MIIETAAQFIECMEELRLGRGIRSKTLLAKLIGVELTSYGKAVQRKTCVLNMTFRCAAYMDLALVVQHRRKGVPDSTITSIESAKAYFVGVASRFKMTTHALLRSYDPEKSRKYHLDVFDNLGPNTRMDSYLRILHVAGADLALKNSDGTDFEISAGGVHQ